MAAMTEGGERKFSPGAGLPAETRLDRLSGDLRYGDTTAPGFAAEGGCQSFGQADCCALHTCIITYIAGITAQFDYFPLEQLLYLPAGIPPADLVEGGSAE